MGHGDRWTTQQDDLLRRRIAEGWSIAQVAKALRRSPGAVGARKRILGIMVEQPTHCLWCGKPMDPPTGPHPRFYDSASCRQMAYVARKRQSED